jgi:hypothetical protein
MATRLELELNWSRLVAWLSSVVDQTTGRLEIFGGVHYLFFIHVYKSLSFLNIFQQNIKRIIKVNNSCGRIKSNGIYERIKSSVFTYVDATTAIFMVLLDSLMF